MLRRETDSSDNGPSVVRPIFVRFESRSGSHKHFELCFSRGFSYEGSPLLQYDVIIIDTMASEGNSTPETRLFIGQGTEIESLSIRDFRTDFNLLRPSNHLTFRHPLSESFCDYFREATEEIYSEIKSPTRKEMYKPKTRPGLDALHHLKERLIDRKIVTGAIGRLAVTQIEGKNLPSYITASFENANRKLSTQHRLEGYDTHFVTQAGLKIGSKRAEIACALQISPFFTTYDISPSYRIRLQKFRQKETSEVDIWIRTILESRNREFHAKTHPLRGGTVNPR